MEKKEKTEPLGQKASSTHLRMGLTRLEPNPL